MSKIEKIMLHVFFASSFALLTGCGSSQSAASTEYELHFQSSPGVNDSAPLKIRVFMLKTDAKLNVFDFYSLQNSEGNVLGDTVLEQDEFFLREGATTKTLTGRVTSSLRYIGIIAEYEKIEKKIWRIAIPTPLSHKGYFRRILESVSPEVLSVDIYLGPAGIKLVDKPVLKK